MLFAEGITIDTAYALGMFVGAGGVIAFLFRMLIMTKDEVIKEKDKAHALALTQLADEKKEEEARKKSYQEIAAEANKAARDMANFWLAKEGKPPIVMPPVVVSESHSPSTSKQRETAAIATMRADMVMLKSVMGLEPRQEPPSSTNEEVNTQTVKVAAIGAEDIKLLKEQIAAAPEVIAEKVVEKLETNGVVTKPKEGL